MSARNKQPAKATRRAERFFRKAESAKRIPFQGVCVKAGDVLGHRYLALHSLSFSLTMAAVVIHSATARAAIDSRGLTP